MISLREFLRITNYQTPSCTLVGRSTPAEHTRINLGEYSGQIPSPSSFSTVRRAEIVPVAISVNAIQCCSNLWRTPTRLRSLVFIPRLGMYICSGSSYWERHGDHLFQRYSRSKRFEKRKRHSTGRYWFKINKEREKFQVLFKLHSNFVFLFLICRTISEAFKTRTKIKMIFLNCLKMYWHF